MTIDTDQYMQMDRQGIWHPYTRHSAAQAGDFPIITKGEGVYLFDAEGNKYLDAISSWWACNLGHSHPRLVEAIIRQARELQHSILGNLSHPRAIELAEELVGLFPDPRHVLFASDGASAAEAALKIAIQYWHNLGHGERNRFASLEDAYHGDTLGAVSVGYLEGFHLPFKPLLFPAYRGESPYCGRCKHGKEPASCSQECFDSMLAVFDEHADELAAVILEPLCQGAAGMRIYPPEYLRLLDKLCKEKDVLLIVDEIAVGFGRTGKMFAFQHAGIDPDIICLGKSLSGGYLPISATVVKDKIFETFGDQPEDRTFYHGHTFSGNPIASAAALETLRIYERERIVEQAEQKGRLLKDQMAPLSDLPHVVDVRCLGMIGAAELDDEPRWPQQIRERLLGEGILVRPLGNVVYLMPPLITSGDILNRTVEAFCNAVEVCR
ncbi:MAG: adenosylmethionine--8-amino-7-oxononanoate transaminase [Desulfobacterales bacterium]|nr:adenosylmethionine--8-amino-7-oxononanoate transaminase [Desulfobacterales bacterium]